MHVTERPPEPAPRSPSQPRLIRLLPEAEEQQWKRLELLLQEFDPIDGTLVRHTPWGYLVLLDGGLIAGLDRRDLALPGSQRDADLIGRELRFLIVSMHSESRRIWVSHRKWAAQVARAGLSMWQEVKGRITGLTANGAVVDVQGAEGWLAWRNRRRDGDAVPLHIGDELPLTVLNCDPRRRYIELAYGPPPAPRPAAPPVHVEQEHAPVPPPAPEAPAAIAHGEQIIANYRPGTRVTGKVHRIRSFALYLKIGDDLFAVVNSEDFSWIATPQGLLWDRYNKRDTIEGVVLSVSGMASSHPPYGIRLGLKQRIADPWGRIPEAYPVGRLLSGVVRRVLPAHVFVELEPCIEVAIATKYADQLAPGQELDVMVSAVDPAQRRLEVALI